MIPQLAAQLCNPSPELRMRALASALALRSDEWDEPLYAAVVDQLTSKERFVRELAAKVLEEVDCVYLHYLPNLLDGLSDESEHVRAALLKILQRFRLDNEQHSLLLGMISDPNGLVRIRVAHALWTHFRDMEAVRGIVLAGLTAEEDDEIIQASQLAAEMASEGQEFAGNLEQVVRQKEGPVRGNALYALSKIIGDGDRLFELAYLSKDDPHPLVRYIVSKFGPPRKSPGKAPEKGPGKGDILECH